jgi:hypothetical protein
MPRVCGSSPVSLRKRRLWRRRICPSRAWAGSCGTQAACAGWLRIGNTPSESFEDRVR